MLVSVTQLNNYIKGVVDLDGILSNIEVAGELSNVRQVHGNWYFSLKDNDSSIDCFSFLSTLGNFAIGDEVNVKGSLNFLSKSGRLSLVVNGITAVGKGLQFKQLAELRDKLNAQGLFDVSRKKQLPTLPLNIGVATSRDGAVIRDISKVVFDRQPFSNIILCSTKVQGEGAADDICSAIKNLECSNVDLIIVARGGGSNDDLSAFNDERVVMAVANCSKPTISAIGHGIDTTLCDMVADSTAITPTEAGLMATLDSADLISYVNDLITGISQCVHYDVENSVDAVNRVIDKLSLKQQNDILLIKQHISQLISKISSDVNDNVKACQSQFALQMNTIENNNPLKVLSRGYAKVNSNGKVVNSIKDVNSNDIVTIRLVDGTFTAAVKEKN